MLGWLCGNAVVYQLLAHSHEPEHGVGDHVAHVHNTRAATIIIAAFMVATAGLGAWPSVLRRRVSPARAGLLSTTGFLLAELAQYGFGDHVVPPPVILALGCLVQALIGTGGAILWRAGTAALRRRIALLSAPPPTPAPARRPRPGHRPTRLRPRWASPRPPGRAPPAFAA